MTLALVCGFAAEKRVADKITGLTAIGWHNPGAAADLITRGATTLISFGIAGGLHPALRSGDLLLPTHIVTDTEETLTVSPDLHEMMAGVFPGARTEPIAYSPRIIGTAKEKNRLFQAEGTIAADMESGMVARAALDAGIPFAVLRTVSDLAVDDLPPAVLAGLTPEGDVDYLSVLWSLLNNPRQLPALIRTGRQSRAALDALREAAPVLKQILG